jgi:hypothetical protein
MLLMVGLEVELPVGACKLRRVALRGRTYGAKATLLPRMVDVNRLIVAFHIVWGQVVEGDAGMVMNWKLPVLTIVSTLP